MNQQKIGSFLKELRKKKNLTQEQLAEKFNLSNRTISRWENGINMPDLSALIELADFYCVDVREIIEGERNSENMNNNDVKETINKVTEYTEYKKQEKKKKINKYFIMGAICFLIVVFDRIFNILSFVFKENISEFVCGALCGLALVFEFTGFYNNNHEVTLRDKKLSLFHK